MKFQLRKRSECCRRPSAICPCRRKMFLSGTKTSKKAEDVLMTWNAPDDHFAKNSTHIVPQPPHSPDLAPYDFWLFPKLKRPLRGHRFDTIEEIQADSKKTLKAIPEINIRKIIKDDNFEKIITSVEKDARLSFKSVVDRFLGNKKRPQFWYIVKNLLNSYENLGCNMSIKVHFLNCHLDYFLENLGSVSSEQGERFHEDIKRMEKRYQGRWNVNMLENYCMCLKGDNYNAFHKRRSQKRCFTLLHPWYFKKFNSFRLCLGNPVNAQGYNWYMSPHYNANSRKHLSEIIWDRQGSRVA